MVVTLDLTARQAARVLAQAVRVRAKLEIEPRPESCRSLIWGTIDGRQDDLVQVVLHYAGQELASVGLVGAMCDVRTIVSGQLCMFSTCVMDVINEAVPRRLTLAVPQTIQVANRRRFARRCPTEPVPVRICVAGSGPPFVAVLSNIGPNGIGCRVASRDLDELLLIGDETKVEFVLPWSSDVYVLSAVTCSKSAERDEQCMAVGFEFVGTKDDAMLQRLRNALNSEAARLIESDGDL
jgi:hypothetical protein